MMTVAAVRVDATLGPPLARASVVPMATTPPPAWPEASIRAVGASRTVPLASTAMLPPMVPGALPVAESCPATVMLPPTPSSTTVPVRSPTVSALDFAAGIDQRLHHAVRRLRGQLHRAAVGADHAGVGDQRRGSVRRVDDLAGHVDRHQPVAVEIERRRPRAGQHDVAQPGVDHAGIGHLRRDQGGQAGLPHGDRARHSSPRHWGSPPGRTPSGRP